MEQTEAEARLWWRLRGGRFYGLKFRRQVPVDCYIADFVCVERKLIVEVDGSQHGDHRAEDEERTKVLEIAGFVVVRYWNNDIANDIDAVLEDLRLRLNLDV